MKKEVKVKVDQLQTIFDIYYEQLEDKELEKWQAFKTWKLTFVSNIKFITELNAIGNRARFYDKDVANAEFIYQRRIENE